MVVLGGLPPMSKVSQVTPHSRGLKSQLRDGDPDEAGSFTGHP